MLICFCFGKTDPEGKWTPHKVDMALWTHYLARELQPTLLDGMPSRDGSTPTQLKDEEEESNDKIPSTISSSEQILSETTAYTTNGKEEGSASDENSLSGPSSEIEDKSNDSLLQNNSNGNGNLNEDSKDFGSECIESEDSRIIPSEENSYDNAIDCSEPALKKLRVVEATELSAIGEEAQLAQL
jgi:hypothetical protein